jgi:hypothetical protein
VSFYWIAAFKVRTIAQHKNEEHVTDDNDKRDSYNREQRLEGRGRVVLRFCSHEEKTIVLDLIMFSPQI